jgi:hypothetical protein
MVFFEFYKKNKQETLKSDDILADLLVRADKDTSLRPLFYKTLLTSELIILTDKVEKSYGETVLEKDTEIKIITFENGAIPIFSSTDRIFDNGIIKNKVPFIGINGKSLLEMTLGGTLILNPYSNMKKELLPDGVESLLSGKIFEAQAESVKKETRIRLGQPENVSEELIGSIKSYCKMKPEVLSAYIALIHKIDTDKFPNLLIVLDITSEEEEIFGEISVVIKPHLKEKEHIDLMPLKGSLSSYFETINPIYTKRGYS